MRLLQARHSDLCRRACQAHVTNLRECKSYDYSENLYVYSTHVLRSLLQLNRKSDGYL